MLGHGARLLVGYPSKYVAGLTFENSADGVEGREAYCLGAAVLEHGDVRGRDADRLGELGHRHLTARKHDVQIDDDGHYTISSSSRRNAVALCSRPRMTTISSANATPPMPMPPPIRMSPGASSISPTCTHSAATRTAATRPAMAMTSTHRNARSSNIAPRRTMESNTHRATSATSRQPMAATPSTE